MITMITQKTELDETQAWLSVGFGPIVDIVAMSNSVNELIAYGAEHYGFGPEAEDWHVVPDPVLEFPSEFPELAREYGYVE